jgi:hypothetical protein
MTCRDFGQEVTRYQQFRRDRGGTWRSQCNLSLRLRGAWLPLFPLGFSKSASNLTGANDCGAAFGSLRDETTNSLLKSASGLLPRFRFVPTVIILQQVLTAGNKSWLRSGGPNGAELSQTRTGEDQSGTKKIPCVILPNSWASPGAFSPFTPKSKLAQY